MNREVEDQNDLLEHEYLESFRFARKGKAHSSWCQRMATATSQLP